MALTLPIYECQRCGHRALSFQECCPSCRRIGSYYPVEREIQGRVSTCVMVHVPEETSVGQVPYRLVWVECGNGLRLRGRLDPSQGDVETGSDVELAGYSSGTPVFVKLKRKKIEEKHSLH